MTFFLGAMLFEAGSIFARRRAWVGGGCGRYGMGGCGPHHGRSGRSWDTGGPHAHGPEGFGSRLFLRSLFERLDTTPGQEKVLARAIQEIRSALGDAKGDWRASRSRMADALRGETFDHEAIDQSALDIVQTAKRTGASVSGPVPLPTRIERFTVLRSPHIDKKSREQFEMRTHKRLIYITEATAKTMDALSKLNMPAGVDIRIKA